MTTDTPSPTQEEDPTRNRPGWLAPQLLVPVALFIIFLLWGWRNWYLFTRLPAYGDVLEVVWGWDWYAGALREGYSPFFYNLVFHPQGWHTATLAHSPTFFLFSLPLYWLGGPAFAYNLLALIGLGTAYTGMFLAARRYVPWLPATLAAVSFTFSWPLFIRAAHHMNILLGAALLPWLLWSVVKMQAEGVTGRKLLFIGLLWGLSICFSFYFLFLGGLVLLACWLFPFTKALSTRSWLHWRHLLVVGLVAFLFNLPLFLLFWQARRADAVATWDITHLNIWGLSLNAVLSPSVSNPWLRSVAAWFYRGNINETAFMGLGFIGGLCALFSLRYLPGRAQLRALAALLIIGVLLGLGVYLKWDERTIPMEFFRPVNAAIWQVGHTLKPQLFSGDLPPDDLATGIPLPDLILVALVPFWEGVRTVARFAFVAWLAAPILAAFVLNRISLRPLRYGLMLLWLFEIVPIPNGSGLPLPDTPHPAHAWLAEQTLAPGEGIIDLQINTTQFGGATLLATQTHGQPTASGVGSQIPAHSAWFDAWYRAADPLDPDLAPLLRAFDVRYVLFTTWDEHVNYIIGQLGEREGLTHVDCFQPGPAPTPWPYPICVLEVDPPPIPQTNLILREGWHEAEPWGVWAAGEQSTAQWVATTTEQEVVLNLEAFPYCRDNQEQQIEIFLNDQPLTTYNWSGCENWNATLPIPPGRIQVGWNDFEFHYAYTAVPAEESGGENPDPRSLSVGFSRLMVEEAPGTGSGTGQ